ncbi:MAG: hypothetical protein F4X47_09365 [Gammaproteobacteria bacterium]|nr:hypothetical protein [Gammaproteobacteria bacterium]
MNRLKLLATATLMALTFTACDEGTPPPVEPPPPPTPVGTISGTVTIEGTAASGITATLSSGATTTTGSGGSFAFSGVEAGTYTVTISGFPEDATFAQVTQSATIATDGQNVQLNFAGEYIRSSAVVGNVVAADAMMSGGDGQPETLVGVTVTLGGEHAMGETMETGEDGGFMFTGLRAGTYTVTISDFPEDVSFETVSVEVEVEVGEVGSADFTGHFIRTSAVEGQVVIEGEGLQGVTVTLSGGPADESYTMLTDADGMFRFEELRPGDYTVEIMDFDPRDYEFAATSQDVSVDLDETGTVSFTGVLLRTSGISGRVSVEGMGLDSIEVTLTSGDDSRTAMTDAGGQYSFAGLAAGDYTVSIAVDSDAYVFESMSSDVTVGDDESAIVNFDGQHARTASVSGMAFIDELDKNDMYDEGEAPLARAGLPVALVGPGVNEQRIGLTDDTGAFSFTGLRSGHYQLVVNVDMTVAAALAAADLAYGGPGTGYSINLGVGEAASQAIPFDITHTTVNFTVSLKHGDDMGAALPGASVTLYGANDARVGTGMTGEDGSVAIKVARAGTSGNMVMAGVAADGYDVADGMTEVSWDPQMFATAAGNSNDIVNLNVDATVSGATITTDYGGGKALAGWAISVMAGDDAVDGAPDMLDDDGNAAFMTTVGADDLPATFTFAVADDQDDKMDGGESYEGSAVDYTHTGLALAGTMDAGTIEVQYSTQTLKVYVHQERDQVMGYTGNLLGGDERDGSGDNQMVSVGLRYVDDNGRSRAFVAADSISSGNKDGVHTFNNVPADKNVIVQASKTDAASSIKLLDPDELAAYTGMEANGITGGAFGAMGGFNHTVELCPLQATAPQDHDECASFAYVTTHTVSGLVWKNGVKMSGDDFDAGEDVDGDGEGDGITTPVPGQTVSLSPVEGKNLAGEEESFTTAEKDTRKDKTKGLDATLQFSFDGVASGAYKLSVPDGWRAKMGDKGATADVGDALNPLGGPVSLDITPATATVYGRVDGGDGFPLEGVTVDVNGRTAMTDAAGRYIVDGVSAVRGKVFVSAAKEGQNAPKPDSTKVEFGANKVSRLDIDLSAVGQTASISGTVRASGTAAPVAGAEVAVTGAKVTNLVKGKLLTDAEGKYTAIVEAVALGTTVSVSVTKKGMSFAPPSIGGLPAHANSAISGIDFTGFVHATITGVVVAPGGGPLSGVALSATSTTDSTLVVHDTTGVTGRFSLSVPYGGYTVAASLANHIFGDPTASSTGWTVPTAPGVTVDIGRIQAMTAMARNVRATRETDTTTVAGVSTYNGNVTVRWIDSADDVPDGYSDAVYSIQTNTGTDGAWEGAASAALAGGDTTGLGRFDAGTNDGEVMVRVVATAAADGSVSTITEALVLNSDAGTLAAVNTAPSGAAARRQDEDATTDSLVVTWSATSNPRTQQRIIVTVDLGELGVQSLVAAGGSTISSDSRSWDLTVSGFTTAAWTLANDSTQTANVTEAHLRKALSVRVETGQGADVASVDDDDWQESNTASVAADPAST